ncbi:hypothetical protein HMPREF3179_08580 [Oligella sp. HMSC09E12]|nr:hypothetical protein HMPREF3179_08580 [Oligella sp. HMSC09E12]
MKAKYNPDFIILPFDILQDDRLTLRQIRVLMAILSWRKKNTNVSAISREMIAERTGYQLARISAITAELEKLGWIKKEGNGGRSKWIRYQICEVNLNQNQDLSDIETVPELETVPDSETVTDLNLNGTQIGIKTVPKSGTRIDTDKEQKEIQRDSAQKIERTHHPEANASEKSKTESSAKPKRSSSITFARFIERCQESGEKPISDYQPVFNYAEKVGLPVDYLNLCWLEFRRRYTEVDTRKRYVDWRKAFLNCVTSNWYRLWAISREGEYYLATEGKQANNLHGGIVQCH